MMSTSPTPRELSPQVKAILVAALKLPLGDRFDIVDCLVDSLGPDTPPDAYHTDEGIKLTPECQAELERRIKEIDDGTAVMIPAEEVFARLREELRESR